MVSQPLISLDQAGCLENVAYTQLVAHSIQGYNIQTISKNLVHSVNFVAYTQWVAHSIQGYNIQTISKNLVHSVNFKTGWLVETLEWWTV